MVGRAKDGGANAVRRVRMNDRVRPAMRSLRARLSMEHVVVGVSVDREARRLEASVVNTYTAGQD